MEISFGSLNALSIEHLLDWLNQFMLGFEAKDSSADLGNSL